MKMGEKEKMVLKSTGKIYMPTKTSRGGARIYIPAEIVLDSTFPFPKGGDIIIFKTDVEIDPQNEAIIIKRVKK